MTILINLNENSLNIKLRITPEIIPVTRKINTSEITFINIMMKILSFFNIKPYFICSWSFICFKQ
jgi:hypothetical protein